MKSFSIRSFGFVVVTVMTLAVAPVAQAADLGGYGWNDYGTYDTWSDYGSYDTWSDYGTYSDFTPGYWEDDYFTPGHIQDEYFTPGYLEDEYFTPGYIQDEYFTPGYVGNEYFTPGYYDSGCNCYSGGSYGGGYSTGGGYYVGATGGYPVTVSNPRYPSTPTGGGSSSSYVSNVTNTNTTVTNIDNSINDSFNNYNSNNVIVNQLPTTPTYPISYQYPAPYCTINQALASGYGVNSAYLSWNASNATSAYLSNVGSVAVSGTQTVWPTVTTTYTLTVYGQNGQTATCATTVYANNYVAQTPYVSLTQIPYTGFDFGTIGNSIYWAALLSFALAAAYLTVYYRGGAVAFATAVRPQRAYAPIVAPKAPILIEREAAQVQAVVNAIRERGVTDTMAIVHSKDGSMPKIVIERN